MWLTSFRAVLKKNVILKIRSRRLSLLEIFFPLYFVILVIIITRTGQKLKTKVPEQIFTEVPILNICDGCAIGWAPSNLSIAQAVIEDLVAHNNRTNITILPFESEEAFEAAYIANKNTIHAGVIFTSENDFSLRFNDSYLPGANATRYVSEGYLPLQRAVHESLINVIVGGTDRVVLNYTAKPTPIPAHALPTVTYFLWAFYFPIIYGYSLVHVVTGVVTEKEKKLKDAMRTMGCPPSAYWFSWFCIQLLMIILATLVFLIAAYASGVFLLHSLPVPSIFITFLLYALSLTTMGFLFSVFADTPRSGVIASWLFLLVQLGLGGVGNFLIYKDSPWVKTLFCFTMPVVPLMESVFLWADAQTLNKKFDISAHEPTMYIIALLVDCIIYGVLAAYFEKALNDSGGFLFFMSPHFWKRTRVPSAANDESPLLSLDRARVSIELRELTKEFHQGFFHSTKQVAVDHLSFSVQRGDIFALLGHNGAGKTTTINMLSGALVPTSGDAMLLGCSVVNQVDTVRSFIGICPQTDIVFDLLTAVEHVELFAGLKGQPVTREEVLELLQEVNLDVKHADEMATGFSGGMKRKLTTAIAFVGGSQVVFLDECTAGMDPFSRRKIWAMLQKRKRNTTIILTTHYMEEADLLGDTIAIMSKGKIQAMGSSLELKNRFGLGYRLTFVKLEGSRDAPIASFLSSYFADCQVLNSNEAEITYQLPRTALAAFPKLFAELDRVLPSLGVRSYGLSMTTLEEVFLRLSKEEAAEGQHSSEQTQGI